MTLDVNYWSKFYSTNHILDSSNFCSFVLDFFKDKKNLRILDAGCGNGRDSYALAQFHSVIGLDTAQYVPEEKQSCKFLTGDFCDYDMENIDLVYSRFTLHSINNTQQEKFISSITRSGTFLCIECRSDGDVDTVREHGDDHYRNFVNFDRLTGLLKECGFKILFSAEGSGFAPYKSEDPICVRFIAEKI